MRQVRDRFGEAITGFDEPAQPPARGSANPIGAPESGVTGWHGGPHRRREDERKEEKEQNKIKSETYHEEKTTSGFVSAMRVMVASASKSSIPEEDSNSGCAASVKLSRF